MKIPPYVRLALSGLILSACSDAEPPLTSPEVPAPLEARGEAGPPQANGIVPGRVLARFRPGTNPNGVAALNGAVVEGPLVLDIQLLSVPPGAEATVAAALARNPQVEFAELDYVRTFGDPAVIPVDDPFVGYRWDLDNDGFIYSTAGSVLASTGAVDADMDWREAVERMGSASGTARIGIMDTGIRNDHEDLTGRIAAQWDFFGGDADAEDDRGHGTHVAGIAAARTNNGVGVSGVAYTGLVDFAVAKVCGPLGSSYGCPTSAIADGIVWAVDNGADVLNLSLGGGGGSTAVRAALQYARSRDVLPFCSAGNEEGPVSFPAAWPECVAVSATDWSDDLASYSNFGPQVELAAPGGDFEDSRGYSFILSAYNGAPDSYAFLAGTSMASPQAAGLGALLHAFGVADDDDKLGRMKSTADDLGAAGTDDLFGAGRINVFAALDGLGSGGANQPPTASFTVSCSGLACDFDGSGSEDSDGSIADLAWRFGDQSGASGPTASHTYFSAGSYTVTLTVTDDDGATDTLSREVTVVEPPVGGGEIGEVGLVTTDQASGSTWHRVNFAGRYVEPVVVMGPPSYEGADPSTVRVRNVTATGFEFQIDEWDYKDGRHVSETIGWMVVEAGTHTLSSGLRIQAGRRSLGTGWSTTTLAGFSTTPVVLSQVASTNEGSAVTTRTRNVGASSFQLRLQEEEAGGSHAAETVHWIAVERGADDEHEAGATGNRVTDDWTTVPFSGSYAGPAFIAHQQTYDGNNTSAIRYRGLGGSSVEIFIEEEASADDEVAHISEDVGFFVAPVGALRAH